MSNFNELPVIRFVEYRFWEENRIVRLHAHDDLFQLDFFPHGEGTYLVAENSWSISNTGLYFIRPATKHEIRGSHEKPLENMTVKFSLAPGTDLDLPTFISVDMVTAHKVEVLFRQAVSEGVLNDPEHLEVAALRLAELLLLLKNSCRDTPGGESGGTLVSAAQRFMRESFDQTITIGEIARVVGVSPEHLCRVFKEQTETTPFGFLRSIRFERAKRRLAATTENVASVARACGIGDAKNINRLFNQMAGMSPREYRKRMRQQGV